MKLAVTLHTSYEVPDGTTLSENGQEFVLPSGKILKVWPVVEDRELGEDLTEIELNGFGVSSMVDFERVMDLD